MASAKISRIRRLLGPQDSDDLDSRLRRRQKIGREERVAAVLLTVALVERWKRTSSPTRAGAGGDPAPLPVPSVPVPVPSVPVPLAPLPPPAPRKAKTRSSGAPAATARELQQVDRLVGDVARCVTAGFLVRLMLAPDDAGTGAGAGAGAAEEQKSRMPQSVRHAAEMLLWEVSQLGPTSTSTGSASGASLDIADLLEPCTDALFDVIFPVSPGASASASASASACASASTSDPGRGNENGRTKPRGASAETIARVLDILRFTCVSFVVRMGSAGVSAAQAEDWRTKVARITTSLLHRAVVCHTAVPTAVLQCVVEVYNFHHYHYHRHAVTNLPFPPRQGQGGGDNTKKGDLSAKSRVDLAIAISRQSAGGLRQLIIQGLHGYASDDVRSTALQAAFFLLKEAVDGLQPFAPEPDLAAAAGSGSREAQGYPSLVPVLWSMEPDDGTNMALGADPEGETGGGGTGYFGQKSGNTEGSAATAAAAKNGSPPVGQFALFLCNIVRIELRLLYQQALSVFSDISAEDCGEEEAKHLKGKLARPAGDQVEADSLLMNSFLCLSIFDKVLLLLIGSGSSRVGDDGDEAEDESAIWAGLPFSVLQRLRRTVHSIVSDSFEFINEAAVMIQSQHYSHSHGRSGSGSGAAVSQLDNLRQLCSRVSRSLSALLMEDEALLLPAMQGVHAAVTASASVSSSAAQDAEAEVTKTNDKHTNVVIDSLLSCSWCYHAQVSKDVTALCIGAEMTDDDLIGGGTSSLHNRSTKNNTSGSGSKKSDAAFKFDIKGAEGLAYVLRGGSMYKGSVVPLTPDAAERLLMSGNASNGRKTHISFSRYLDQFDSNNAEISYSLGQGDCLQFLLPVFLSVTETESQNVQFGISQPSTLLQVLTAPTSEFTSKVVKLVQVAIFVSSSSVASSGRGLDRVYGTGALACDQVALLLEHYLTEAADTNTAGFSRSADTNTRVLGISREQWGAFLGLIDKSSSAPTPDFSENAAGVEDAFLDFKRTLKELGSAIELLSIA